MDLPMEICYELLYCIYLAIFTLFLIMNKYNLETSGVDMSTPLHPPGGALKGKGGQEQIFKASKM